MNKLIIFSSLLLTLTVPVNAQQNVQGIIIDHDDHKPVSKASILINRTTRGTVSRDDGHFSLDGVYPDDTLIITHLGYRTEYVALAAFADTRAITIRLKKEATNLSEVTVYSPFWTKQYTPEEQQEDYLKFCTLMEKMHPGLFTYLSKNKWQALKDSTMRLLQYSLSHSEFFQVIAFHVASVRDKHTRHGVTDWWYRQKQNIFPFNIKYFGDRLFVAESLVPELVLPKGTEILSVNGRSPAQMKSMIWPFIPADGYIQTGRMADLNDYFPWYFSLFVEETKTYTITLRALSGEEVTIDTPGLRDSFAHLSFQQVLKWRKPALELQIDEDLKTAYFCIDDSHSFKDSLETYFNRIQDHEIKYLIIDLRGGGGIRTEEHTVELFAHLTTEPFRVFDRIEVESNDATVFDRDFSYKPYARSRKEIREKHLDLLVDSGEGYYLWEEESYLGVQKPEANPFKGVVYILIDGRNYSASTDFASLAAQQDNIFTIGEETGGEYRSYASGAMYGLGLPNSKIGVKIPSWKTVLAIEQNEFQRGRGVLPDFYVPLTFQDFMQDRDAVKELAYELIKNKQ